MIDLGKLALTPTGSADACRLAWVFIDGGPVENELRYCPGCGRRLLDETAPTNNQENQP